jgi:hypothetical protein
MVFLKQELSADMAERTKRDGGDGEKEGRSTGALPELLSKRKGIVNLSMTFPVTRQSQLRKLRDSVGTRITRV